MKIELDSMTIEGTPKELAEYLRLTSVVNSADEREDASAPVGVKSIQEQTKKESDREYVESLRREVQASMEEIYNKHARKHCY